MSPLVQPAISAADVTTPLLLAILVLALGLAAAVLIRRWQSRQALVRRLAELTRLAEAGRALAGAELDSGRLADLVYQQVSQIVDASTFQLGLFDGNRYRLLLWVVDGQRRQPAEFELTADSPGIIGWLRDHRQSLLVRDFEREADSLPARPRYVSPDPPRSAVFVPLMSRGSALGAVAIQSRAPNAFDQDDLRLLTIVANQAAAALENARQLEQARRRAAQLELLAEASQRINVLQPLPALYRQIVVLAADKFPEFSVSYYECDHERLALSVSAAGADPDVQPADALGLGEGPAGQAAQQRQPVTRVAFAELKPAETVAPVPVALSQFAVPVQIDERVLGVLLISSRSASAFDADTQSMFQALAAQMAMAILEAQLYVAEQRRADQLAALAEVSRTVASSLELDDLLDEVLDVIGEHFGYKTVRIFLLSDDRLVYRAGIGPGTVGQAIEGLSYPLAGSGIIAGAGRGQRLARVDDVSQHPDYIPGPGLAATRSEMAAPIHMGARLLGVLDVQSDRAAAFGSEDERTLQTLADSLAVAVRNARLFEFERQRRRLAEIMREVSAALTSTLQLDHVLDLILDGLALVVSYDAASILLQNDAGEMILRATRGSPAAEEAIGTALTLKRFEPGETPSVLPFGEVDLSHQYHDLLRLPEPHACLAAALAPGGEQLGYLVVDRSGPTGYPAGEVALITTFASQAAVAIANARLYTAQREQAWLSTALLQVADATARATLLDDVLETVANLTPLLAGVDRCAILMAEGDGWRLAADGSADDAGLPSELSQALGDSLTDAIWPRLAELRAQREPMVVEPDETMPAALRAMFGGTVILLPLLAHGALQGIMVVGQVPGDLPFGGHRIQLLTGIANQAALAVESAMLSAAQQEEAWVSTALLQVAQSVAGQPLEVGLETVARLTPILVGLERIAIYQYEPAERVFRMRQVTGLERSAAVELGTRGVVLADLGLVRDDPLLQTQPPWHLALPPWLAALFGGERCSVWPLRARGDILGALVTEAVDDLGRRQVILDGIAHQLAMAMENARLAREVAQQERLERELEVGRDIQASLLPQTYPQAEGWQVSALWRAARQVGGDFYDFFELRPDAGGHARWGVVIADVADKGVPAALFMAMSRTLLRTVAIGRVAPADTLRRVNELILSDARSDQFVTVVYGVLDPADGRFCYAIAGHNPPVWVRADGTAGVVPGRGIALGVLDQVTYQEQEVRLGPGDSLLLYTDGLTEAINVQQEEFGLRRVVQVARANHDQSARGLLQALTDAAEAHVAGAEVFDDLTVVVVKRSG